jgi:hypothetical protein
MIEFDLLKVGDGVEIEDRDDLVKDLELGSIIGAIAQKDDLVARELSHVLLLSRVDVNSIKYRQEAVKDAIQNRNTILDMYKLTNNIIEEAKRAVFLVRYDDARSVVYNTAGWVKIDDRCAQRPEEHYRGIGILVRSISGACRFHRGERGR